jgi:type II secretory ATPase GspE/PulE/Tfp pilus assembly ATPase PilB-like protein
MTGHLRVVAAVAPESQVREYIRSHFLTPGTAATPLELEEAVRDKEEDLVPSSLEEVAAGASRISTIRIVDFLLADAIRRGASDVHIEADEAQIRVRDRIDGDLRTMLSLSHKLLPQIVARVKIMAEMDIGENRRPQDGGTRVRVDDASYELRVSTLPGIYGETVVIRILDHNPSLLELEHLGFAPEMKQELLRLLNLKQGMLLITGPTGSGKTSTLYAALNRLNRDAVNIVTVEDPVEYKIPGITQVQTNEKAGRTFPNVLRSMVRQDPDIIMVGEIRDQETAEIACRAALTGHLVLSTLHTQDAPGALARLLDIGVAPYIVTASLNGVLAQRLLRRVCEECAESYDLPNALREAFEAYFQEPVCGEFRRGKGCPHCQHTGNRGRIGVYELVTVDEPMRRLLAEGGSLESIERYLAERGFRTMEYSAFQHACAGRIAPEEVIALGMGISAAMPVLEAHAMLGVGR